MPEYLSPGVYVEEVAPGPRPIEGVSTSTAGMVGMTVRGPVEGLPQLVTSFPDFQRKFGGYLPDTLGNSRFLAHAVRGFFENGGKRVYIRRVPGFGNATAAQTPPTGVRTRLTQTLLSGSTTATLATLRGVDVSAGTTLTFTQVRNGVTTTHASVVSSYDSALNQVTLATPPPAGTDFDSRYTQVDISLVVAPDILVKLSAADPGAWGNEIVIRITHSSRARAQVVVLMMSEPASALYDTVQLNTTNNFYVNAIVELDRGTHASLPNRFYARVTEIKGDSLIIKPPLVANELDPVDTSVIPPLDPSTTPMTARTCEFSLSASYAGINENYPTLTLDSDTSFYFKGVINNSSNLLRASDLVRESGGLADYTDPFAMPSGEDGLTLPLVGGADGSAPADLDYIGTITVAGDRTGLLALEYVDEISIVAVPGITTQSVQNALIMQCEKLLDRFAVLDPDYILNSALDNIRAQRSLYDTKYAALYFPNLRALDPSTGLETTLPPSGHVAGIYAFTDNGPGVHKAPANVAVRGITGLDLTINQAEQDILNPENINVIRDFRTSNLGIRVWGARSLTSDPSWRYVPVRRLFLFIEESIEQGIQWVVFEPNDPSLWARVRQSISNFLVRVWRDGALMGATQEEAFFVRCDRTTMTQDDIDNGRLIVLVGIAPVKPAEFVIVRIQQYTAEANLA